MDDGAPDPIDALREEAITLASRIRIALPYRRASPADLVTLDAMLGRLAASGLPSGDSAVEELSNLRETLEILTTPSAEP